MTYFIKYKGRFLDVKKVQELKAKEIGEQAAETTKETSSELEENVETEDNSPEVAVEPTREEKQDDLDERKAFIKEN